MHAETGLHEHVIDGVVMWNVASGAFGLHAAVAGTTMDVAPVARDHRCHRMTAAAKLFARGSLNYGFRNNP